MATVFLIETRDMITCNGEDVLFQIFCFSLNKEEESLDQSRRAGKCRMDLRVRSGNLWVIYRSEWGGGAGPLDGSVALLGQSFS